MKSSRVILVLGILISLVSVTAVTGNRLYDLFEPRVARWPPRNTIRAKPVFLGKEPREEEDYFRLISYLNDVGKRRR